MPSGFWDYIHLGRSRTQDDDDDDDQATPHNLQEGLFQIASQTCNILVQVNNTKNINFGPNFHYESFKSSDFSEASTSSGKTRKTTFFDLEQSVVLLQPKQTKSSAPTTPTRGRFHRLSEYKRRLSVSSWRNIVIHHNFVLIKKRKRRSFRGGKSLLCV